jgi:hypothetical protein
MDGGNRCSHRSFAILDVVGITTAHIISIRRLKNRGFRSKVVEYLKSISLIKEIGTLPAKVLPIPILRSKTLTLK